MKKIQPYEKENFESLLHRFKKAVINGGTIDDFKRHEAFLPKNVKRKEKQKRAKIRRIQMAKKKPYKNYNNNDNF